MRERRRKFTPEFKDEAVKMVIESSRPVAEVAREIQVNEGTLGNWVHKYRLDHVGEEPWSLWWINPDPGGGLSRRRRGPALGAGGRSSPGPRPGRCTHRARPWPVGE